HERQAIPVPEAVGWAEAGAFPEVFTTAHDALFTQAGLRPGEHLLVHGAAGGVGTAAVQMAVAAGAGVTASVRHPELRPAVEAMGAAVIDPAAFEEAGPYDVILELVGAGNLMGNLRSLRTGGRICVIGVGGTGPRGEIDLSLLMGKRARIHGSTLRARPLEGKAAAARLVESQLVPLLAAGRISPPLAATFPLEAAADAYERFRAGAKLGKVVLIA
ncbi:MAG: zinc-binding dehydrogenase, partial [Acidimicrobiales bacterium]